MRGSGNSHIKKCLLKRHRSAEPQLAHRPGRTSPFMESSFCSWKAHSVRIYRTLACGKDGPLSSKSCSNMNENSQNRGSSQFSVSRIKELKVQLWKAFMAAYQLNIDRRTQDIAYISGRVHFIDSSSLDFKEFIEHTYKGLEKYKYGYNSEMSLFLFLFASCFTPVPGAGRLFRFLLAQAS